MVASATGWDRKGEEKEEGPAQAGLSSYLFSRNITTLSKVLFSF
ncbi:MAG: hypothetical protein HW405_835 [Candidatus Berkelbacteria bacterium]|nr:hypothetical protein [Candidatus Berkelbacteria bacterium]